MFITCCKDVLLPPTRSSSNSVFFSRGKGRGIERPTRPQPSLLLVDARDKGARGVMGNLFAFASPLTLPYP